MGNCCSSRHVVSYPSDDLPSPGPVRKSQSERYDRGSKDLKRDERWSIPRSPSPNHQPKFNYPTPERAETIHALPTEPNSIGPEPPSPSTTEAIAAPDVENTPFTHTASNSTQEQSRTSSSPSQETSDVEASLPDSLKKEDPPDDENHGSECDDRVPSRRANPDASQGTESALADSENCESAGLNLTSEDSNAGTQTVKSPNGGKPPVSPKDKTSHPILKPEIKPTNPQAGPGDSKPQISGCNDPNLQTTPVPNPKHSKFRSVDFKLQVLGPRMPLRQFQNDFKTIKSPRDHLPPLSPRDVKPLNMAPREVPMHLNTNLRDPRMFLGGHKEGKLLSPKDGKPPISPKDVKPLISPRDSKLPISPKEAKSPISPKDSKLSISPKDPKLPISPKQTSPRPPSPPSSSSSSIATSHVKVEVLPNPCVSVVSNADCEGLGSGEGIQGAKLASEDHAIESPSPNNSLNASASLHDGASFKFGEIYEEDLDYLEDEELEKMVGKAVRILKMNQMNHPSVVKESPISAVILGRIKEEDEEELAAIERAREEEERAKAARYREQMQESLRKSEKYRNSKAYHISNQFFSFLSPNDRGDKASSSDSPRDRSRFFFLPALLSPISSRIRSSSWGGEQDKKRVQDAASSSMDSASSASSFIYRNRSSSWAGEIDIDGEIDGSQSTSDASSGSNPAVGSSPSTADAFGRLTREHVHPYRLGSGPEPGPVHTVPLESGRSSPTPRYASAEMRPSLDGKGTKASSKLGKGKGSNLHYRRNTWDGEFSTSKGAQDSAFEMGGGGDGSARVRADVDEDRSSGHGGHGGGRAESDFLSERNEETRELGASRVGDASPSLVIAPLDHPDVEAGMDGDVDYAVADLFIIGVSIEGDVSDKTRAQFASEDRERSCEEVYQGHDVEDRNRSNSPPQQVQPRQSKLPVPPNQNVDQALPLDRQDVSSAIESRVLKCPAKMSSDESYNARRNSIQNYRKNRAKGKSWGGEREDVTNSDAMSSFSFSKLKSNRISDSSSIDDLSIKACEQISSSDKILPQETRSSVHGAATKDQSSKMSPKNNSVMLPLDFSITKSKLIGQRKQRVKGKSWGGEKDNKSTEDSVLTPFFKSTSNQTQSSSSMVSETIKHADHISTTADATLCKGEEMDLDDTKTCNDRDDRSDTEFADCKTRATEFAIPVHLLASISPQNDMQAASAADVAGGSHSESSRIALAIPVPFRSHRKINSWCGIIDDKMRLLNSSEYFLHPIPLNSSRASPDESHISSQTANTPLSSGSRVPTKAFPQGSTLRIRRYRSWGGDGDSGQILFANLPELIIPNKPDTENATLGIDPELQAECKPDTVTILSHSNSLTGLSSISSSSLSPLSMSFSTISTLSASSSLTFPTVFYSSLSSSSSSLPPATALVSTSNHFPVFYSPPIAIPHGNHRRSSSWGGVCDDRNVFLFPVSASSPSVQ